MIGNGSAAFGILPSFFPLPVAYYNYTLTYRGHCRAYYPAATKEKASTFERG